MTDHSDAHTPNSTSAHLAAPSASSTPRPQSGPPDVPTRVDLGHIGKRTAQVGGLAIAAYVMTAVASGHGVASADTGEATRGDSVTSSVHNDPPDADAESDSSPPSSTSAGGDEKAGLQRRQQPGPAGSDDDEVEDLFDLDSDLAAGDPSDTAPERHSEYRSDVDAGGDISDSEAADADAAPDDVADDESRPTGGGATPEVGALQADAADASTTVDASLTLDAAESPDADAAESPAPYAAGSPAAEAAGEAAGSPAADAAESPTPTLEPATADVSLGASGATRPAPAAPLQAANDASLFGWVRRTFFNRPPTIRYDATLNSQDMSNGVITGNLGAVDPDGDQLTYSMVRGPQSGTVVINPLTGDFVFTPTSWFAQAGGTDSFTVRVSDSRFHLLSYLFKRDRGSPTARVVMSVAALNDPESTPPLETFIVEKVVDFDLPDGVTVTGAELSPDSEHLILEVKVDGNTHIAVTNLDGGDYRCISCGVAGNTAKARAFYDNQRIWFANTSGQQSADDPLGGAGAITYSVLECEGSIYACQNPTVKKVKFPSDKRLLPVQNREAKPDPFGEYVTWTENTFFRGPRMSIARLVPTAEGYKLVDQRIFSPQWVEDADYAEDFSDATRFYEGASWHAGGRYLKYQTTSTGLNYDIYLLDTATGERRQLTTDLDYNESGDVAPDGNSIYFSSARGLDRMDVFTALKRPSLIDSAAFPQIGRVSLWNNRRSMNEPWLMNLPAGQQQGGYSGQPIIIDPDWTIRGWSWFPDSTRAVINEQQRPDTVTPGAPDTPWRVSIISFPTRTPTAPLPPVHQDPEAIASWSIPVEDYNPMMGRQDTRVLDGAHSGTATLRYRGIFAWGTYSVTYKNYSDDGKTFINGTEKVTILNPMGNSVWSADLTSEGEQTGYLKGTIKVGKKNAFSGDVSSEINGVTYSGVPTQTEFPGVSQPQLAISSSGDRIRVTARVAEDSQPRPVRGASVTVGAVTMTTDEQGYVQIPFGAGDLVTASAGGFQAASHQMPNP